MSPFQVVSTPIFALRKPGWIELGGSRVCLFDSLGAFYNIREQLAQEVGIEAEAEICQRAGYFSAEKLVANGLSGNIFKADDEGFKAALAMFSTAGYGQFDLIELKLADGWARIVATDSLEGWMYHEKGTRHGNTCDFTRGVLSGLMHFMRAEVNDGKYNLEEEEADPIGCVETSCLAAGEESCTFVVGVTSDLLTEGLQPAAVAHSSIRETLLRLNRQLEHILDHSRKDHLTNLFNRPYFESALRQKIGFAKRRSDVVSLAVIDVDHFKTVNDTQGHAVGDRVLRQLAYILESQARENDIVARLGGDEFVWLMPATPPEAAASVARRIGGLLESMRDEIGTPLTVSVGVAGYPRDSASPSELLESADNALYVAKEEGRNRVVLCGTTDNEPGGQRRADPGGRSSRQIDAAMPAAPTERGNHAVATPPKLTSLRTKSRFRSASRSGRR